MDGQDDDATNEKLADGSDEDKETGENESSEEDSGKGVHKGIHSFHENYS